VSLVLGWLWVCAGDQHCFRGSNQLFDVPEEGMVLGALQLAVAGKLGRVQELNGRSGVLRACRAVGSSPKNNGTGLGCDGCLALPGLSSDVMFSQEVHPQDLVHTVKVRQHMNRKNGNRSSSHGSRVVRAWMSMVVPSASRTRRAWVGGTECRGVGRIRR
jgi:hypothetical protein